MRYNCIRGADGLAECGCVAHLLDLASQASAPHTTVGERSHEGGTARVRKLVAVVQLLREGNGIDLDAVLCELAHARVDLPVPAIEKVGCRQCVRRLAVQGI